LVINSSMVDRGAKRDDITEIFIPANDLAEEVSERRLANMIATGALLAALPVLMVKDLEEALNQHMPGRHKHLLQKNFEALRKGEEFARQELSKK